MRSKFEPTEPIDSPSYKELQLLDEVEETPDISQRELPRRLDVALGLTNMMLRNLAQKGYLRVTKASWKQWIYNLTPEGFSHKVKLTLGYFHRVLDHYKTVRATLREQLEPLALNKESRIAFYGTGEFAELVYLGFKEIGIEEIDFFAPENGSNGTFLGMPVQELSSLKPEHYDRVVVAILNGNQSNVDELNKLGAEPERIVTFFGGYTSKGKV